MVDFSIVCPIRDEVSLIPITLPSFYALYPSEVILCLDKPARHDLVAIIERVAEACDAEITTHIIEVEKNPEYRFNQAWIRRCGFREAQNDLILTVDVDIILDPALKEHLHLIGENNIRLVSFAKTSYPISYRKQLGILIHRFYKHKSFTGTYAFSKQAWLETESEQSLKQIPRGEDTHLHHALTRKYDDLFVSRVKNILLRPKETARYQFLMGYNRWKIRKTSLWPIILASFLYFEPSLARGYVYARLST